MQVQEIEIKGYRSIYDLSIKLGHVNLITGANGCGKSNLFNAFRLAKSAVEGRLSEQLASEGGMESILWAGPAKKGPKTMMVRLKADPFEYSIELGLRPISEQPLFPSDAQIKKEILKLSGRVMVDRGSSVATLRGYDGSSSKQFQLIDSMSVFSQISDPELYPYMYLFRDAIERWAFYHDFRTDSSSVLRHPMLGTYPFKFAEDGSNLAPTLYLISKRGAWDELQAALAQALPEAALEPDNNQFRMHYAGIQRAVKMHELSDGTLKFLCLAAACCSAHPPPLMVFNEPESSLSPAAIAPLASLLSHASVDSQIWVTSHSEALVENLVALTGGRVIPLEKHDGETVKVGGSRRGSFVLDDD